ncbi:14 kDa subunit of cytochrome bd ubiquinol oxidase [Gigaspora margarita]|uniref:Cytochrome b-c1 complex subunit 7 n=1 Tax=Gigaspora margarita TaxID=4874 RepID=A0A8H4A2G9_GIGMA|nr:14 kDa subunit of cytochrome bd ubiquinol oxidase [Gigaspora margarita]
MPYPTLYNTVKNSRFLYGLLKPVASFYANIAGYRQLGLRYDDILDDENDTAREALKRVSPKEQDLRNYRIRTAFQLTLQHNILSKEKWTKPEDDVRYLSPHLDEVVKEEEEREAFDAIKVVRK